MGRNNFWRTVGIILLVLVLFGVVSVGDILGVAARIFMTIIFLLLAIWAVFAFRIYRARRIMQQRSREFNGGGFSRRHQGRSSGENDVTLQHTASAKKSRVNQKVGDYVDFEDVK